MWRRRRWTAYERLEYWGSLGNHLRSGWSLDQSSRERKMLEQQGEKKKSQAHLGTIQLVNKGTIKTISSITNRMGCHIMKGLSFVYFKEKEEWSGTPTKRSHSAAIEAKVPVLFRHGLTIEARLEPSDLVPSKRSCSRASYWCDGQVYVVAEAEVKSDNNNNKKQGIMLRWNLKGGGQHDDGWQSSRIRSSSRPHWPHLWYIRKLFLITNTLGFYGTLDRRVFFFFSLVSQWFPLFPSKIL